MLPGGAPGGAEALETPPLPDGHHTGLEVLFDATRNMVGDGPSPRRPGRSDPQPARDRGPYTFVWPDALVIKVREHGRTVNVRAPIAVGVNADRRHMGLELLSKTHLTSVITERHDTGTVETTAIAA